MPQASCSLSGSIAPTSAATGSWAEEPALADTTIRIPGIRIRNTSRVARRRDSRPGGPSRLEALWDGARPGAPGLLQPLDGDHRAADLAQGGERGAVLDEKRPHGVQLRGFKAHQVTALRLAKEEAEVPAGWGPIGEAERRLDPSADPAQERRLGEGQRQPTQRAVVRGAEQAPIDGRANRRS